MIDLLEIIRRWMGVDRIRVSNQTGRMGRLQIGDRFLWEESILEVVDREIVLASESQSCVRLVLEDTLEQSRGPHELFIYASAQPRLRLVGKLRLNRAYRALLGYEKIEEKVEEEIEINDDDIVRLQPRNLMHD